MHRYLTVQSVLVPLYLYAAAKTLTFSSSSSSSFHSVVELIYWSSCKDKGELAGLVNGHL